MTPVILGLDPSPLRLGYGAIRLDNAGHVMDGVIHMPTTQGRADYRHLHRAMREAMRVLSVKLECWAGAEARAVYIERPAGGRNAQQTLTTSWVAGHAAQAAWSAYPLTDPHSWLPQEWKRGAGLPGNATKAQVQAHIREVMGVEPSGEDAADALAIAYAGWRELQAAADRVA